MWEDGINKTRYKMKEKVATSVYTKISVDLLYNDKDSKNNK